MEAKRRRMDLFDLNTYFESYVPVQARSHLLLKHAACAYAAKQLGRAKRKKSDSWWHWLASGEHGEL